MALYVGIGAVDYWHLTYGEIVATIEVYNSRKEEERKENEVNLYTLANLIGLSVARLFSEKNKFPTIYELFPDDFNEISSPSEDWRVMKERFLKFAKSHNAKKGGGEIDA